MSYLFCSPARFSFCCASILLIYPAVVSAASRALGDFQTRDELAPFKRDNGKTFEINFDIAMNDGELYGYNCSVGTPPQNIVIALRPWISDIQLSNNTNDGDSGPWPGVYQSTQSKTYEYDIFMATYAGVLMQNESSENLYGVVSSDVYYSSDNFAILGVGQNITLDNVAFISLTNTSIAKGYYYDAGDPYPYNWLGLGLASSQSAVVGGIVDIAPYPTFPQYLMKSGITESNTYSIWLDAYSKKSGHVLFGGVNSKRYHGSLVSLQTTIQKTFDYLGLVLQKELTVAVDSLTVNASARQLAIDTSKSLQQVAFAHSPYTTLPLTVAKQLWDGLGANYTASLKGNPDRLDRVEASVSCSFLTNTSTIDLKFAGAPDITLQVPLSYITVRAGSGLDGDEGTESDICKLLIHPGPNDLPAMLGTGFLKNLYTVYDLDNTVMSIALTDFNSTSDNLVAIPTGGIAALASSGALGTSAPASSTATSSPTPTNEVDKESAPKGNSTKGLSIGLGVGIPALALLAGAAAFFLFRRRRSQRKDYGTLGKSDISVNGHGPEELSGLDKKPEYELMSNPVSEVAAGRDATYKAELPQPGMGNHEVPIHQRHELA